MQQLPDLEILCPHCKGMRIINGEKHYQTCSNCKGSGFVPTEEGKKILELMRHNFKGIYNATC